MQMLKPLRNPVGISPIARFCPITSVQASIDTGAATPADWSRSSPCSHSDPSCTNTRECLLASSLILSLSHARGSLVGYCPLGY